MNVALWIIAGLLATIFLVGGVGKLIMPKDKIAATPFGGWVEEFTTDSIRAIGALEILAALGLILPAALDIAPIVVPLASLGLVFLMAGAAVLHYRRGEFKIIAANLAYLFLAGFLTWGRLAAETFTS